MSSTDSLSRLEKVASSVFFREVSLTRETTAENVEEWDSLSHMQLIMAIEKEFGIKFSLADIARLANVGDLLDIIAAKG